MIIGSKYIKIIDNISRIHRYISSTIDRTGMKTVLGELKFKIFNLKIIVECFNWNEHLMGVESQLTQHKDRMV